MGAGTSPLFPRQNERMITTMPTTHPRTRLLLVLLTVALALCAATVPAGAQGDRTILLLVDSSGSMDEPVAGGSERRIDAAKSALYDTIDSLQAGDRVGLRAFGLSSSCSDGGRLLVPVSNLDRPALRQATGSLSPTGETPTPAALQAAIGDLPGGGNRQIVLVSDGESSCGDPCYEMRQAVYSGIDVTVHTVGFSVSDEAQQQLACIAAASGGTYFPAPDSAALDRALSGATRTKSRTAIGRGTGLIQLLINSYAHEDWDLVRRLNPARASMSNSQLLDGWGGMEEAWAFGVRERSVGGSVKLVDTIYVTHERVVPALARKKGLRVGAPITQSFCITWRVDTVRRTVQERAPRWSNIESGYLDPASAVGRRSC